MEIQGGCLCGTMRYVLTAELQGLSDCHCVDCRRSAGAPYVTWGSVRPNEMRIVSGNVRKVPYAERLRYFAECCGTHLFFKENDGAEWVDVTVASLDEPSSYAPQKSVWTEDKLPWVTLDPKLPSFLQRSTTGT
jgi:hypothetical protein